MKNEAELMSYLCDMDQLAYVRPLILDDGDGKGCRIIEVNNGTGLRFTIAADRGMGLCECSIDGINVAWRSPRGYSAAKFDNFLADWQGGLMTPCGLRHAGGPENDQPLHGKINLSSAEQLSVSSEWIDGKYRLQVIGTLREAFMFGENLRLRRTITTYMGDNTIYIDDEVKNLGPYEDYLVMLYHCNFGYPLVDENMVFSADDAEVIPRNDDAKKNLDKFAAMPAPSLNVPEEVFFHIIKPDADNFCNAVLTNEKSKLQAVISGKADELPNVAQWKSFEKGRYVCGIEPTNCLLAGREGEIKAGRARKIAPLETVKFSVKIALKTL